MTIFNGLPVVWTTECDHRSVVGHRAPGQHNWRGSPAGSCIRTG